MSHPATIEQQLPATTSQQSAPSSMPQPVDTKALRNYLKLIDNAEAFELQQQLAVVYDKACAALIGENDVQKEGARTFKKKTAWKKLARYFGISTQVVTQSERYLLDASTGESVFVASCTVRAAAPWGQLAESVGACATDEESGRRTITIADAIATAETRASNRAISNLIAMGEVSAEELSSDARKAVQEETARNLTLDDARAMLFPWTKPEKYKGKTLADLSHQMLTTMLAAVEKDIAEKGETVRRVEMVQACKLVIADMLAHPDVYPNAKLPQAGDAAANPQTASTSTSGDASSSSSETSGATSKTEPRYLSIVAPDGVEHLVTDVAAEKTLCDSKVKKSWPLPKPFDTAGEQTCEACIEFAAKQS